MKLRFITWMILCFPFFSAKMLASEKAILENPPALCFVEDFSDIVNGNHTETSGSNVEWSGNTNFPLTVKTFQAGNAVRLGTSSLSGSITSRPLMEFSGNLRVEIDVKGWTNVEGYLLVTFHNKTKPVIYTNTINNGFETVFLDFSDVPAGAILKIETNAKRAIIDEVRIYCDAFEGSSTDYFRSVQSGDWHSTSTWESSPSGEVGTWNASPLFPDEDAAGVIIQNGTQVQILRPPLTITNTEVFGILEVLTSSVYEVVGDEEYELKIKEGGVFLVNAVGNGYDFGAKGLVEQGGKIVAGSGFLTGGTAFVNAYIGFSSGLFSFEDLSLCEWANPFTVIGSTSPVDADFFRPASLGNLPVFKISETPGFPFGSSANNTLYCTLEIAEGKNLKLDNAGNKTIIGGIKGNGELIQNPNSGNLILGNSSTVPVLDNEILISIQDEKMLLPYGLLIPETANVKLKALSGIQNTSLIFSAGNIDIQGILDIDNLKIQNSSTGSIFVRNHAKIKTRHTEGLYGLYAAIPSFESGKLELEENSSVEYYAAENQIISTGLESGYGNLILTGGIKIPNGKNLLIRNFTHVLSGELIIPETPMEESPFVLYALNGLENTGGIIRLQNNANLMQNPGASNSGEIILHRKAVVPSIQYNLWSSPVKEQDLYNLYPDIPLNRIMVYNTETDYYTILPTSSNPHSEFGVGYSIKGSSTMQPDVVANFIGIPQNESLNPIENFVSLSTLGSNYNLIGNPFPSNLDLVKLYLENEEQFYDEEDETPLYYFWDNTDNTDLVQQGSNYVNQNFAVYNPVSQLGVPAPRLGESGKIPNGIARPGQGFIIRARETATGIQFNNEMRTTEIEKNDALAPYYKESTPTQNSFYLKLITPDDLHLLTAIGYFEEAENSMEKYDSPITNAEASDLFYSFSEERKKLIIQGRKAPFECSEKIPLGIKAYKDGFYKIEIENLKGIFTDTIIYLLDNQKRILHNLSQGPYEFELRSGNHEKRFEIVFQPIGDGPRLSDSILWEFL